MKVLWFSNTMANADEYFNTELKGTGGWLKALDQSLQKHVELHVAFETTKHEDFKYKETFYHPIVKKSGFIKKVLKNFTGYIDENEYLTNYLEIII